jgi:hypothetical protein
VAQEIDGIIVCRRQENHNVVEGDTLGAFGRLEAGLAPADEVSVLPRHGQEHRLDVQFDAETPIHEVYMLIIFEASAVASKLAHDTHRLFVMSRTYI